MDLISDKDWLGYKNPQDEDSDNIGNIAKSWQWRERGFDPPNGPSNKTVLENVAEDILVQKRLQNRRCDLPGYPRSTFLMVFSPDGTKVASTHGNHNIYVSELASGKHVCILKGHPRTPWCIAFHPSHPQLIGSGCLGGQVRVWDLSGGSETWTVETETVISSLAFHPRDQILVIATFSELYFWNWSQPAPFTRVSTNSFNEKVKYVAFDSLGYKLITGIISDEPNTNTAFNEVASPHGVVNQDNNGNNRREPSDDRDNQGNRQSENDRENIVNSYQHLVHRYDILVRNYQRLFLARHQLTNRRTPNTTDRGTDPMETDSPSPSTGDGPSRDNDSGRNEEQRSQERSAFDDRSRRILDALSINTNPSRPSQSNPSEPPNTFSQVDRPTFPSRTSAFQRFSEFERRLLFAAYDRAMSPGIRNPERAEEPGPSEGSSRTSIFVSPRQDTPQPRFLPRRRNFIVRRRLLPSTAHTTSSTASTAPSPSSTASNSSTSTNSSTNTPNTSSLPPPAHASSRPSSLLTEVPSPETASPLTLVDAQMINESLDLIRDILRDSGARLLNLITNMSGSLDTIEGRAEEISQADSYTTPPRSRDTHIPSNIGSSESDSDSDDSREVNIYRTRNDSFSGERDPPSTRRSNRVVIDLNPRNQSRRGRLNSPRRVEGGLRNFLTRLYKSRFRVRDNTARNRETSQDNDDSSSDDRRTTGDSSQSTSHVLRDPPIEPPVTTWDPSFIPFASIIRGYPHNAPGGPGYVPGSSPQEYVFGSTQENVPGSSRENVPGSSQGNSPGSSHENVPGSSQENVPGSSQGNAPGSSRGNIPGSSQENPEGEVTTEVALRKVQSGVRALTKHTRVLSLMLQRGRQTSFTELLRMWDALRRRVLTIDLQTRPTEMSSATYARSVVDRFRLITELSRNVLNDMPRIAVRRVPSSDSNANSTPDGEGASTSNQEAPRPSHSSSRVRLSLARYVLLRKRLNSSARVRPHEERRSSRGPRQRETITAVELQSSRSEIRVRAMQVLSILFYMMMDCLEENGLSQIIINMLQTLKRALRLTCLLLVTNPNGPSTSDESMNVDVGGSQQNNGEPNNSADGQVSSTTSTHNDHNYSPWVPGPSTSTQTSTSRQSDNVNRPSTSSGRGRKRVNTKQNSSQTCDIVSSSSQTQTRASTSKQRWSNRLAVQISAANRNYSSTATNRRELYIESRREKALHRCNPLVHPISKRKIFPPSLTHRIPKLCCQPTRRVPKPPSRSRRLNMPIGPVPGPSSLSDAGPSNLASGNIPGPSSIPLISVSAPPSASDIIAGLSIAGPSNIISGLVNQAGPSNVTPGPSNMALLPSSITLTSNLFAPGPSSESNVPDGSVRGDTNNAPDNRNDLYRIAQLNAMRVRNAARERLRRLQTIRFYSPWRDGHNEEEHDPHNNTPPDMSEQPRRRHGFFLSRGDHFESVLNQIAVPIVQVNEPVVEGQANQPPAVARVQPIILAPNAIVFEEGHGLLDTNFIPEGLPIHRVQAWDFTSGSPPDIAKRTKNVVVQRCRIHNDASIDISKDGRLLVALLPVPRLRNSIHRLGVYSLEWNRLGECLYTAALEQSAVSVALSPTARYLAVGLGSRRYTYLPHPRNNVFAFLYKLSPTDNVNKTAMTPVKELKQNWEHQFTSLNCLRWAPQPGQGLVYANNTGQLIIMS